MVRIDNSPVWFNPHSLCPGKENSGYLHSGRTVFVKLPLLNLFISTNSTRSLVITKLSIMIKLLDGDLDTPY